MQLLEDFHKGHLDVKRLNYGIISLIPKIKDVVTIKQYRPIALINVSLKIITKSLTQRMIPVVDNIIDPSQTTFIKDGNILEGVVMIHEIIHELKRRNHEGIILKLDFEKAYDKVNWSLSRRSFIGRVLTHHACGGW